MTGVRIDSLRIESRMFKPEPYIYVRTDVVEETMIERMVREAKLRLAVELELSCMKHAQDIAITVIYTYLKGEAGRYLSASMRVANPMHSDILWGAATDFAHQALELYDQKHYQS